MECNFPLGFRCIIRVHVDVATSFMIISNEKHILIIVIVVIIEILLPILLVMIM